MGGGGGRRKRAGWAGERAGPGSLGAEKNGILIFGGGFSLMSESWN